MHKSLAVACEPVAQFDTAMCTSTAVLGPPDAVTSTVSNLSKQVEPIIPPEITRVIDVAFML